MNVGNRPACSFNKKIKEWKVLKRGLVCRPKRVSKNIKREVSE
jgi:hypothetical protein